MSHSLNSSTFNRRRSALRDDIDRSAYTAGQTLASVVNDPRAPQHTFSWGFGSDANKKDVPTPIDPIKYPPVSRQDLQQYLSVVSGTFERFLRDRHSLEAHDVREDAEASTSQGGALSGAGGHQGEAFVQAMQQVPPQYFQEDFEDKWHDFFVQFCQSQDQDAEQLYEQIDELNKYLDTVEMQLLKEVAARSNSFFRAASSLQHLRGLLCDAIDSVKALRRRVGDLDSSTYRAAVTVTAMQHRRQNLVAVLDVTKALEDLLNCQQALDCLLESQDYAGALELLENMTHMLANQSLAGLQCIRHLPPQVKDTIGVVENMLAQEFVVAVSHSELPKVVERAVKQALQQPGGSEDGALDASPFQALEVSHVALGSASTEQLHDKLLPLAVGLHKADKLAGAMAQYKENAAAEVKSAVRDVVQRLLPALLAAAGDGAGLVDGAVQGAATEAQLADQLQMLQHGDFMSLLRAVLAVIESCMERALTVGALVEDILKGAKAPASQLQAVRKDTAGALQQVVDVGQGRWVKLVAARTNAHMRLKLYELRQLLDLSEAAAARAEQKGAKPLPSYRMALQAQCKAFLDNMHSRSVMQLQHLLESEQWVVVEVPASFQQIVDRLVARCEDSLAPAPAGSAGVAAVAAGSANETVPGIREGPSDSPPGETSGQAPIAPPPPPPTRAIVLTVRGKSFHLVNSALMLLKLLDEYLSLHDIIPSFGAEIVHRLLELLKFFNSHTCQLVLGAGAMRTAGLKSISAKQLALSCQCVAAVATLQPLLRACSLAVVSNARRALLMPEFDRLMADLNTHMDEIHSKLVDIMADRLAAAVKQLPGDMSALTVSPDAPLPTITMFARQMMTLKSVLGPILLPEETEYIFGAVTRQASEQLSEAFEGLVARGSSWEPAVATNALYMLRAFKELPLDKVRAGSYTSRLSTFYTKHFGLPPEEAQRMSNIKQQQAQHKAQQQQQPQQQLHSQQQPQPQSLQELQPVPIAQHVQQEQPQQHPDSAVVPGASEQDVEQLNVVAADLAADQQEQEAGYHANGLPDVPKANGIEQEMDENNVHQQQQPEQQPLQQQPEQQSAAEAGMGPVPEAAGTADAAMPTIMEMPDAPLQQQDPLGVLNSVAPAAPRDNAAPDQQPEAAEGAASAPLAADEPVAPSIPDAASLTPDGAAAVAAEGAGASDLAQADDAAQAAAAEFTASHATEPPSEGTAAVEAEVAAAFANLEADSDSAPAATEDAAAHMQEAAPVHTTAPAPHGAEESNTATAEPETSTSSMQEGYELEAGSSSEVLQMGDQQAESSINNDSVQQPERLLNGGVAAAAQQLGGSSVSQQLASASSSAQPLDALFAELDEQQEQEQPDGDLSALPFPTTHPAGAQLHQQQQEQQSPLESHVQQEQPLDDVDLLSDLEPVAAPAPEISAFATMVAEHVSHSSGLSPVAAAATEDDPLDRLGQADTLPANTVETSGAMEAAAEAAPTAGAPAAAPAAEAAAEATGGVEAAGTAQAADAAEAGADADVMSQAMHAEVMPGANGLGYAATSTLNSNAGRSADVAGVPAAFFGSEQLDADGSPAPAYALELGSSLLGDFGSEAGTVTPAPAGKAAAETAVIDPLGVLGVVATNGAVQQRQHPSQPQQPQEQQQQQPQQPQQQQLHKDADDLDLL